MKTSLTTLVLLAISLPLELDSPSWAQNVRTVNASGSAGSFLDIQSAVDASAPGDTVLVKTGSYDGFQVMGKGISVAADRDAAVTVTNSISVQGVPAGEEFVLAGITSISAPGLLEDPRLSFRDCTGSVVVQDVYVEVLAGSLAFVMIAVGAEDCSALSLVRSTIVGVQDPPIRSDSGEGLSDGTDGVLSPAQPAVLVVDSNVQVHGCDITGSRGVDGPTVPVMFIPEGGPGGPGIVFEGGAGLVVDSVVRGGKGGTGGGTGLINLFDGGAGGPALQLSAGVSPPAVVVYGSNLTGGEGGDTLPVSPSDPTPPLMGAQGPSTLTDSGSLQEPVLSPRSYHLESVLRDGVPVDVTFEGEQGDLIWLAIGFDATATSVYLPEVHGMLFPTGSPLFLRFQGALGAAGSKTKTLSPLPTGLAVVTLFEQAFFLHPSDGLVASNPRALLLVSSSTP